MRSLQGRTTTDAPASDETGAEDVEFFDDEIVAEPVAASPQEAPAAESIAAKLQRIRAVVSQTADKEEFSEDEHAESFVETARAELAQVQEEHVGGADRAGMPNRHSAEARQYNSRMLLVVVPAPPPC